MPRNANVFKKLEIQPFTSSQELIQKANEISDAIRTQRQKPVDDEFQKLVLNNLDPHTSRAKTAQIVLHLRPDLAQLTTTQLRAHSFYIATIDRIKTLRKNHELPPATRSQKIPPISLPARKQHSALVEYLLTKEFTKLHGPGTPLSTQRAREIGLETLDHVYPKYDANHPTSATFSTYFKPFLRGKLIRALKEKRLKEVEFYDTKARPTDDAPHLDINTTLNQVLHISKKLKIAPYKTLLWTLRYIYGHNIQHIADHFGVKKQAIDNHLTTIHPTIQNYLTQQNQ